MSATTEQLAADTIRVLAMDAVQRANSGHPGMPMGMADLAVVLWSKFLRFDPADPGWPDRDRFVLSNGHGSMLLYSLLHLTGFALSMDDLRNFRQWGLADGRPSRAGPGARDRAHDRPARAGLRRPASAWRSPRRTCDRSSALISSTTTPTGSSATVI